MRNKAPNLRHLRAFSVVAKKSSISSASKEIFLSQPAITQAIAKLENELGLPLFDRRADGMYITEAGDLFVDRVDRMLRHMKAGANEAASQSGKRKSKGFQHIEQLMTGVQVRALIALSEAGSFSLAAKSVGVSQPSLHRAARDLEHLSGVTFFQKVSRGIKLTKAAELLSFHCRLALSELEQGYDELEEWKGHDAGSITIGTMPLARTFLLPTAINALMREKPETKIRVIDGPYNDLLHGLRYGEIDLLIGALRNPLPIEDITQESLFEDPVAIVGKVDHPLSSKTQIAIGDLRRYPWVVPPKGTPTRHFFDDMIAGQGEDAPQSMIESSSLILIRGLLQASDRLTIISQHQIRHEEQMGLLTKLNFDMPGTSRSIGLTIRKDWRPTNTQAHLIDLLKEAGSDIHSS